MIALIAILAGLLCYVTDFGRAVDHTLRDARDAARARPATGEIHIVEIDAKSLAEIDSWPWPRRNHARVVDRLTAAGVRSIAFDVDFSSRSRATDDAMFAEALKRAGGSVILPTFKQRDGSGANRLFENLPIAPLRNHAFLASVNVSPDDTGQVRDYETGLMTANVMRPSIAAMLAEESSPRSKLMTIDQAIEPATIPRHSFIDVVSGRVPKSALAGKRIIIGATAIELGDRYAVPRHGVIPGVVIQAMAAETLLQGTSNPSFGGLPLMLFAALVTALRLRSGGGGAWQSYVGIAIIMLAPLGLEFSGLGTFDVAPALLTLVIGGALMIAQRLAAAFRKNRSTDSESGLPNALAFAEHMQAHPDHIVVGGRIARYAEIVTMVGADGSADLVKRIAERLAFAADGGILFRCDTDVLIWSVPLQDGDSLPDRIAALAMLFKAPIHVGQRAINVGLTYGITSDIASDAHKRIAQALLAADRAAEQGLHWDRHDELIDSEVDWKLALLAELDDALEAGHIWVAYQPKINIASGLINGAEALVRWNHPTRGAIAPDHFIPTIERAGRMQALTRHVLRRAIADLEGWYRAGQIASVAVNLSAASLEDTIFVDIVAAELADATFDPSALTLEITETATMARPDQAILVMSQLRRIGVRLSIDDYGTGQSTLTYLKRLPINEIKIDRSFVKDIANSRNDQILVRSTIALGHDLGFDVVAEGVETEDCLAQLRALGCDSAQGWLIGRPMSADAFSLLINQPLASAA